MDPITHGLLGAVSAEALLHKQNKNQAWIIGGLAAMAPDLDVLIRSAQDPLLFFVYHRHFTHALLFIPLGALLVTLILCFFKSFRVHWKYTYLAAFIGYGTHALLDACTQYGTLLFWPFSLMRVNWNIVSIIDLWVTIPLALGLLWTKVTFQLRGVVAALVFVALFFIHNIYQHYKALHALTAFLAVQKIQYSECEVFPKFAQSLAWTGIVQTDKELLRFAIDTPFFKRTKIVLLKQYPLFRSDETPAYLNKSSSLSRDLSIFYWFCKGYLIVVNRNPLLVTDGRFILDTKPPVALWGFAFLPNKLHAKQQNYIPLVD